MDHQNVTLGEVHRLCLDIKAMVKEQNGRVRKLEDDANRLRAFAALGAIVGALWLDWVKHKLGF
jgi:hypothetical protein